MAKRKFTDAQKLPKSAAQKAAGIAQSRGRLSGVLSDQSRLQTVLRGAFGPPRLRQGGTNAYGYEIKKPKADKGYRSPWG